MSENLPPNYNNDQPLEEFSFANTGNPTYYRFGSITPGLSEGLVAQEKIEGLTFYQRVYDSVLGWCYYKTFGTPDSNPPAELTSPSYLGTISDFQILNVIGVPER
jgi:hypothetical protein